jgi:hypothetical protein
MVGMEATAEVRRSFPDYILVRMTTVSSVSPQTERQVLPELMVPISGVRSERTVPMAVPAKMEKTGSTRRGLSEEMAGTAEVVGMELHPVVTVAMEGGVGRAERASAGWEVLLVVGEIAAIRPPRPVMAVMAAGGESEKAGKVVRADEVEMRSALASQEEMADRAVWVAAVSAEPAAEPATGGMENRRGAPAIEDGEGSGSPAWAVLAAKEAALTPRIWPVSGGQTAGRVVIPMAESGRPATPVTSA